jgi:hypothetical protein
MSRMQTKPTLEQSCADPAFVAGLAARNIKYCESNEVPEAETFKGSGDHRWWRLIDAKGHANPRWKAQCYNVSKNGRGCPHPGINPAPSHVCDPECLECRKYTVAAYAEELAARNMEYCKSNVVPAHLTMRNCNDERTWRLIDARGHINPSWDTTCNHVLGKQQSGCPHPGINPSPKRVCDPNCMECRKYTVAAYAEELAARNMEYCKSNVVPAHLTMRNSGEERTWRLIDAKGHANPTWKAACASVVGKTQRGCPHPGINPAPSHVCDPECLECRKYTVAAYAEELAARNMEYCKSNVVPAHLTMRNCNDERTWRLIDARGHINPSWDASCNNILGKQQRGCPYPGINPAPKKVCDPECLVCRKYTVAAAAEEYAERGTITYCDSNAVPAGLIMRNSNKKYIWQHKTCGGSWRSSASVIASGSGCPHCRNKTEARVQEYLQQLCAARGLEAVRDAAAVRFPWCINAATGRALPYDIVLRDAQSGVLRAIVEVDGAHHFISGNIYGGSHNNSRDAQRRMDTYKAYQSHARGVPLLRIEQEGVWEEKWDWRAALAAALDASMTKGTPQYLAADDALYDGHKADMAAAIAAGAAQPYAETAEDIFDSDDESESKDGSEDKLRQHGRKRKRDTSADSRRASGMGE